MIFLLPLLLFSCSGGGKRESNVIAEVNGEKIYIEDALKGMPKGLSGTDSARYVHDFVSNKVKEILMYDKAERNIPQSKEVDEMVENYRRSLILYEYEKQVLNERIKAETGEDELKAYYDKYRVRFTTDRNLVKGLFLKVPKDAPKIDQLRQWYRRPDTKNLEKIESYCVQNAVIYNYFMDQWISDDELLGDMPHMAGKLSGLLRKGGTIDIKDDKFCYMVYISDYVSRGSVAPFEYIKPVVENVMLNARKTEFLRNFEQDLVNEAEKKGKIKYY